MTLYVEMPPSLKERLVRLATLRHRKITAEAILAVERYVAEEEVKEGIGDEPRKAKSNRPQCRQDAAAPFTLRYADCIHLASQSKTIPTKKRK